MRCLKDRKTDPHVRVLHNVKAVQSRKGWREAEVLRAIADAEAVIAYEFCGTCNRWKPLDCRNRLIGVNLVSQGSLSASVVCPREVFKPAIVSNSAAVIFLHNHPSGDPAPSREDRECTARLHQVGILLGIRVLDHIVCGDADYFSFADAGCLQS